MTMTALACQMESQFSRFVARKGDALIDEPLDGLAAVFDDKTRGAFIAHSPAPATRVSVICSA